MKVSKHLPIVWEDKSKIGFQDGSCVLQCKIQPNFSAAEVKNQFFKKVATVAILNFYSTRF